MRLNIPKPGDDGWLRDRRVGLVALVLLVVGGLVAWQVVRSGDNELRADAVMRIGDREITQAELEERLASLEALYGVKPPEEPGARADFDREAAKSMALSIVLEDEAAERGIEISEKESRAELDKIVDERLGGDRQQFLTFLGDEGLSEQVVLEEIVRTLQTNELYQQVTEDVPDATSADAKAEFDKRKAEMRTPERRRLRNIVVADQANAERVADRLIQGDPFAEVARAETLDPSTRKSGGDLGVHAASDLEPAYAEAAFAAQEGQLFGPVQTQYGWNVGQVVEVVPGDPLSFADVQVTLLEAITSRRQLDEWRSWLSGVLEDANVQYADRFRPDNPTGAPSSYDEPLTPRSER
ncbi:peptidyl-prolyl cis-trans isomerase [Nocardioides sp. SYSU DS0651]|uniref:peptidyl-prolyl cis-trans isomerase n=1 Tax=Nocardioides sp. SYSU DS0651 TaxID=3415955 RepID=UPI003F4C7E3A